MMAHVISNKTQHEKYLTETEKLISLDPEPGRAEGAGL